MYLYVAVRTYNTYNTAFVPVVYLHVFYQWLLLIYTVQVVYRYYRQSTCVISVCCVRVVYSYEYIGTGTPSAAFSTAYLLYTVLPRKGYKPKFRVKYSVDYRYGSAYRYGTVLVLQLGSSYSVYGTSTGTCTEGLDGLMPRRLQYELRWSTASATVGQVYTTSTLSAIRTYRYGMGNIQIWS